MRHLLLYLSAFIGINQGLRVWFNQPNLEAETVWIGEKSLIKAGDGVYNKDQAWENLSLPIGNGSLGANIMGSIATERITFNEKTLWRGGPNTSKGADYYWDVNKHSAPVLKEMVILKRRPN